MKIEIKAMLSIAKSTKAQGSLEYIMMLAAASIVIVIALAMIVKMKEAVVTNIAVNGSNMSVSGAIAHELSAMTANSA
ncbi:MAG: hypothetical protein ACP5RF_02590 [Candidatus Micrarchaeia archaeon]